jgi:hypothetical protein
VYWRTRTSDGQQLFYGPPRVYTGIRIKWKKININTITTSCRE